MLYGGHAKTVEDLEFLEKLGCDFGEVILNDHEKCEAWLRSGVRSPLPSGLLLIAHGPDEGPPNDPDNLWHRYCPALRDTVEVAAGLGIGVLTIHLWTDPRFVKSHIREQKREALGDLVAFAAERGVRLCLENLSETADDLAENLDAVPGLNLTLDIGHGQLLSETNTAFAIIERLIAHIKHVHVHDNRGGKGVRDDLHLPIGDGIIDFEGIFEALLLKGYEGTVTLELEHEVLAASLARVKETIRRIERSVREGPGALSG
jgi:sugar phosphate isomerase/epimerase